MKTNPFRHIALLLTLALQLTSALAQQVTNMGTDFWLTALPNYSGASNCSFYIFSEQAGSVSIYHGNTLVSQQPISAMGTIQGLSINNNHIYGASGVDNKSLHVTSTTPITVFVYNLDPHPSSLDASLILPTPVLDNNYVIQTYPSIIAGQGSGSNFAVVATEDNTTVDITLTAADIAGHAAGTTVHQVLNQGQVIRFQSGEHDSFSGSKVQANHPVAVFEGNRLTSTNNISRDHCYHQAIPTSQLGKNHVTMPAMGHDNDIIRITATAPATSVQVQGAITNLSHTFASEGDTWEFHISETVSINSNKDIAVAQWQPSRTTSTQGGDWGDVAFFPLPPVTNMAQMFRFKGLPMDTRASFQPHYYFNIVVPSGETSMVSMNGTPMTGFTALGNSGYSYKRVQLNNANSVTISTTGTGAQVVAYGTDENWGGYYMLAGYSAPHNETIIDTTIHICPGQTATYGNNSYTEPGDYQINYVDDNGVATIVNIHVIFYTTSDIEMEKTFCEGSSITFGGQQISEGGDYVFDAQDLHGCPIHINLHVTESPNYSLEKDTTICDGEYIYFYNMVYYNGDHTATFHTVDGCDSIVTLHIHTLHRSYTEIYDTLTESTYQFGDRTLYSAGEYEERLTNQWGCDSIVTLHLWAEPCRLWVPNIFTPDEETNNRFVIFGCGLLQADVWIFDRGGDFVAHFDGLTETWDGTHHGVPCRVGTYVYRIAYRCTDDTHLEHVKVGAITLVR